jgi:adenylate cyclase
MFSDKFMLQFILKKNQSLSVNNKVFIVTLLISLLTCLLATFCLFLYTKPIFLAHQTNIAHQVTKNVALSLIGSVKSNDLVSTNVLLKDWVSGNPILSATIYNNDQRVIAEYGQTPNNNRWIEIENNILDNKQLVGRIISIIDLSPAFTLLYQLLIGLFLTGLVLSVLLSCVMYLWSEKYRKYTLLRILSMQSIDNNTFIPLPIAEKKYEGKELDVLINQTINNAHVKQTITDAQSVFPKQNLVYHQHYAYQQCGLVFIEISNLEDIKKSIPAQQLSENLEKYHKIIANVAKLYNGHINRYSEKGLSIIFNNEDNQLNQASHCLFASYLLLMLLKNLTNKNRLVAFHFNIAAHWAPVLTNNHQAQYFLGDSLYHTANLANKGSLYQILVSQALHEQVYTYGVWQKGPAIITDQKSQPPQTYWLESLADNFSILVAQQAIYIETLIKKDMTTTP